MNAPLEPGLDRLVRALTADGQPGELGGRDSALAAFRAANQPSPAQPRRSRRSLRIMLPARVGAVVAAGAAAAAGFTAAAYAQVLPGPVQQIAHSVLAPIGVPNVRPHHANRQVVSPSTQVIPGSSGPASVTGTVPVTGSSPAVSHPSPSSGSASPTSTPSSTPTPTPTSTSTSTPTPSSTPSSTPAGGYLVTLAAARGHVPSAAVDVFTGRVTRRGQAAADVTVQLQMRVAGTTTWEPAGAGQTGPHGYFRFSSPSLTTTAAFRVAGPGGGPSPAVRVTVGLPVRIRLVAGAVKDQLVVTAKAARPGDTAVLQELVGGVWTTARSKPLGPKGNAAFTVAVKVADGNSYRGEVLIAGTPAPSAPVLVPQAKQSGAATVLGGPTPTGSPGPTPTPSPAPTGPSSASPTPAQ